jgi:nucleoside-diphosphate-sugar epimerase
LRRLRGGRPGEAYNITGGAQATVLEVIDVLAELLGRGVRMRHLPPVPGDARHTGADIEKARRDLGYTPRTGLKEGLSKQLGAATRPRAGAGTQ